MSFIQKIINFIIQFILNPFKPKTCEHDYSLISINGYGENSQENVYKCKKCGIYKREIIRLGQ